MGGIGPQKDHLERSNRMLSELLLINSVIRKSDDLQSVLNLIVSTAARSLGFEIAVINLRDFHNNRIELRAYTGLDEQGVNLLRGASYSDKHFYALLQKRESVGCSYFLPKGSVDWENDIEGPVYFPYTRTPEDDRPELWHPEDALLALIQVYDGDETTILGDIWVDNPVNGLRPDRLTMQMLAHFADQAAISIHNMNLLRTMQVTGERMQILHQVSQEIVSAGSEPEVIYEMIHAAVAKLMPCEAFVISTVDEGGEITAVYLVDRSGKEAPRPVPQGRGLSSYVISNGKTLYIHDTHAEDKPTIDMLRFGAPVNTRSLLAVPMHMAKRVTGMLSAQSYSPNAFTAQDQRLLEVFAAYAAIALENARLFSRIQRLAVTDPLTGISNRRHLFDLGNREFQRALRFERDLAAIMVDIDHFKILNDSFGHLAGDHILVGLARTLESSIREVDLVARYGGEEFVILMPETGVEAAQEVAERLRVYVARFPIGLDDLPPLTGPLRGRQPKSVFITISLGVAVLDARTPDFETLLARADTAMYIAKSQGRNRVETWR